MKLSHPRVFLLLVVLVAVAAEVKISQMTPTSAVLPGSLFMLSEPSGSTYVSRSARWDVMISSLTNVNALSIGSATVDNTEFGFLNGVTSAIQPQFAARPTGSGTANRIAKFTTGSAIGNSLIYDTGLAVGIGTTTPVKLLTVEFDGNPSQSTSHGVHITGANGATGNKYILDLDTVSYFDGDLYGVFSHPRHSSTNTGSIIAIEGWLSQSPHTSHGTGSYHAGIIGHVQSLDAGWTNTVNYGVMGIARFADTNAAFYAPIGNVVFNDWVAIGLYDRESDAGLVTDLRGTAIMPTYPFHFLDRSTLTGNESSSSNSFFLEKRKTGAFTENASLLYLKRDISGTTSTNGKFITANNSSSDVFTVDHFGVITIGATATLRSGTGTPEGVVTATVGSVFLRTDSATSTYFKQTGSGNTGWVASGLGGSGGFTNVATAVLTYGATVTPDIDAIENITRNCPRRVTLTITLTGNVTTFNVPTATPIHGDQVTFQIIQDGTGNRTVGWAAGYGTGFGLPSPIITTNALYRDWATFIYTTNASKWDLVGNMWGFAP